jgi:hypothetical protein
MRNILIISFVLITQTIFAQKNDSERIKLNVYIPISINMPNEAKGQLENKLNQITSSFGLGGNEYNPRFVITVVPNVLSKQIISGAPTLISQNIDFTFYIGDGIDNTLFSSVNISTTGVGENLTKSYIEAIKGISTNDIKLKTFLNDGKDKIIDYYLSNCEIFLKKSETLVKQGKYDEAIYELNSIPPACQSCYMKCQDRLIIYFQQKIDIDCAEKINQANSVWTSTQNGTSARKASQILISIHPLSNCRQEVTNLFNTIRTKIENDERAAWEFKVKQYQDEVNREEELLRFSREDAAREFELSKVRTEAFKRVAIEFAKNQPKTINNRYYTRINWW